MSRRYHDICLCFQQNKKKRTSVSAADVLGVFAATTPHSDNECLIKTKAKKEKAQSRLCGDGGEMAANYRQSSVSSNTWDLSTNGQIPAWLKNIVLENLCTQYPIWFGAIELKTGRSTSNAIYREVIFDGNKSICFQGIRQGCSGAHGAIRIRDL